MKRLVSLGKTKVQGIEAMSTLKELVEDMSNKFEVEINTSSAASLSSSSCLSNSFSI